MSSSIEESSNGGQKSTLVSHFKGREDGEHAGGWNELWLNEKSDLWDRGFPSPPLSELIAKNPQLLSCEGDGQRRKRVLVPGCGRGYDPVMLALRGFDAYGLEVSSTAVAAAERYAASQMDSPSPDNFPSSEVGGAAAVSAGDVTFLEGDYFSRDWEEKLPWPGGRFDIIYDYTFLCALPPTRRKAWAERAAALLKPGGLLICLEFPLWKASSTDGPPWGLEGVYQNLLAEGGDGILIDEDGSTRASLESLAFKKLLRTKPVRSKPVRSFPQGRDTDMISVWERL